MSILTFNLKNLVKNSKSVKLFNDGVMEKTKIFSETLNGVMLDTSVKTDDDGIWDAYGRITKKGNFEISGQEGGSGYGYSIVAKFKSNGILKSVKLSKPIIKGSSQFKTKSEAMEFYLGLTLNEIYVEPTETGFENLLSSFEGCIS